MGKFIFVLTAIAIFYLGAVLAAWRFQSGPYSQTRFCPTGSQKLDDELARATVVRYLVEFNSYFYADKKQKDPLFQAWELFGPVLPSDLEVPEHMSEWLNVESSWTYDVPLGAEKFRIDLIVTEGCSYRVIGFFRRSGNVIEAQN